MPNNPEKEQQEPCELLKHRLFEMILSGSEAAQSLDKPLDFPTGFFYGVEAATELAHGIFAHALENHKDLTRASIAMYELIRVTHRTAHLMQSEHEAEDGICPDMKKKDSRIDLQIVMMKIKDLLGEAAKKQPQQEPERSKDE